MSVEPSEKSRFYDLQRYLEMGQFPKGVDRKEKMSLKMLSRQFISHNDILYKKMPTGKEEA